MVAPSPFGHPDWLSADQFNGRQQSFSGSYVAPAEFLSPVFYVGDSTMLSFLCELTHAAPWLVNVMWLIPNGSGYTEVTSTNYAGSTACTIFDNLNVIAPYVQISVNSITSGQGATVSGSLFSANGNAGATAMDPFAGMYINNGGLSIPNNTLQTYVSPILSPGVHQCLMEITSNVGSGCFLQTYDGFNVYFLQTTSQSQNNVGYWSGQVVIPNVQVEIQISNQSGAAQTGFCTLAKGD